MFTGIVQARGNLISASPTPAGKRLAVTLSTLPAASLTPGDSVCVSGVCLTLLAASAGQMSFDVITETLNRTTLGQKRPGDPLNLELSLQPNSFVGGHFVQGHVDAVGRITSIQNTPQDWRITTRVPPECLPLIVPKGSIAIEGVSMTIAAVDARAGTFTLAVIPTTLERTTLGSLGVGDAVNLETDILARTVVHYLQNLGLSAGPRSAPLTLASLVENGFV